MLDRRRINWRYVAAPHALQVFSALRLHLAEIAAATAAMATVGSPARRRVCKQTPTKAANGRER